MRFALLLTAVILILGTWAGKQYHFLFTFDRESRESSPYFQEMKAKFGEETESKYPVKAKPNFVRVPAPATLNGARLNQNSFVVPKSSSRSGKKLPNPFVGN